MEYLLSRNLERITIFTRFGGFTQFGKKTNQLMRKTVIVIYIGRLLLHMPPNGLKMSWGILAGIITMTSA